MLEVVRSLPQRDATANDGKTRCAVCNEPFSLPGESLRMLPCCHEIHTRCIDHWCAGGRTCGTCHNTVRYSDAAAEAVSSKRFNHDLDVVMSHASIRGTHGSAAREASPSVRLSALSDTPSMGTSFELIAVGSDRASPPGSPRGGGAERAASVRTGAAPI